MSHFWSLARGVFSQDMNLLQYKQRHAASRLERIGFPLLLVIAIMGSIGYYAFQITQPLAELGLAELLPIFFVIAFSLISLFEGIFKAQGILFDCRDDALLFSLPVSKYQIFILRILKLISFQILFNSLFIIPAFGAYAVIVQPGISFYVFSVLMLFLVPLIPTAIAIVVGYLVRVLSLRLRFRKLFQIIFTFAIIAIITIVMLNSQDILATFIANAGDLAATAGQIYYPAGAYARLIQAFNFGDFLGLLAACILPLLLVSYLCSRTYFRVISRSHAHSSRPRSARIGASKRHSATSSLLRREISRYFSSPVFVVNTMIGLILLFVGVIACSVSMDSLTGLLMGGESDFSLDQLYVALPTIYVCVLVFMLTMTSITSSSISIEGKSFNLTRSLPLSPLGILWSKLLASLVVTLPVVFVCDLIFIIRFPVDLLDIIIIFAFSVLVPLFSGLVGLLVNLKYPKMDASSDTEVVKQSASSMISVMIGMAAGILTTIILAVFSQFFRVSLIALLVFLVADIILWRTLCSWGVKKFLAINV